MVKITPKIIKTDITCVKCLQKYILAGVGSDIHLFNKTGIFLQAYTVFEGQKIHGIIPNSTNKLAVFGANKLKILEFDFIQCKISKELVYRNCDDWIFALQWVDADTQLATIFANNYVSLWSSTDLKLSQNVCCAEKCTLYSATLLNDTWTSLYAFSGTVFGHVLIWKPAESVYFSPVLWRLSGHDGAIFSIAYSKQLKTIVTTSDDRTVRLWATNTDIFNQDIFDSQSAKIILKRTMYGHIARVFRCKIIRNFIVTAGEDSFVHIWDFDGNLIRKFETHQGGSIWALDHCEEEDLIVTGAGDCGVSLYPLLLCKDVKQLAIGGSETPRSLKLTASDNIVLVMDNGLLKYYKWSQAQWLEICVHEDLKSYAVLEVSVSKQLIALAGLHGTIHIYKEIDESITKICSHNEPDGKRVFSLHWLNENQFLTSINDGIMYLWQLSTNEGGSELNCQEQFVLPACKERWATSAALCFGDKLAVGDRKGNIHLYELGNKDSMQTIKKAHCHLGVTSLHFINNQLFSLGRNGVLNKYKLNSSNNQLFPVTNDKLPFAWLASIFQHDNTTFLVGFSGSSFVIFNLDTRRIILELNCGGGHRSWDTKITSTGFLNLLFIKEKQIHSYTEKWTNISTKDLISGYHTKEINCGSVIRLVDSFLFVSGGEDTTIRFSIVDLDKNIPTFNSVCTLKSHLSNVRCLTVCHLKNNEYLIFSGGGRAQILAQKLCINYLDNNIPKIDSHQIDSYYKQLTDDEAETRIMDLVTIKLDKYILLIAGCSDGTIKCYSISLLTEMKLNFICELFHTPKCVIKLSFINICKRDIIVSMATDGKLTFWDLTELLNAIQLSNSTEQSCLKPFYMLQVHQSGINSVYYKIYDNDSCVFVTGGDDNLIAMNVLKFECTSGVVTIIPVTKWNNVEAHTAQITGVYINDNSLITASVDQRISVFKYKIEEDVLKCDLMKQYYSALPDIQGMHCIKNGDGVFACVYGKGLEICEITCL